MERKLRVGYVGYGGSDAMLYRAFIESVKYGYPMPTDIYDTAILMCI